MWQVIAVWIIVGAALVLVARGLYRSLKGKAPACSCGCGAECPMAGGKDPPCKEDYVGDHDKPHEDPDSMASLLR